MANTRNQHFVNRHRFFEGACYRWGFWLRLFWGYGVSVRPFSLCGLSFSERHGHVRYWRIGAWVVKPLTPLNSARWIR